ncbi:MAG: hypothetical protein MPI93_09200 [Nitrosopumilus sp.]|nr:hypothetical protein [Nitrosopumilus sp.]MDA7998162.1 hypothetical protein [Nitrosopumilus sp.]
MGQAAADGRDILHGDVHRQMVSLLGIGPVDGRAKLRGIFFLLADDVPGIRGQLGYSEGMDGRVADRALEHLRDAGMASEGPGGISITGRGREAAGGITGMIDGRIMRLLGEYRELLGGMTDREMLAFIYAMFPAMASGSPGYADIKPDMEHLIMSLVEKEKISSGRAAELLGVTQDKIFNNMRRMGIQIFY